MKLYNTAPARWMKGLLILPMLGIIFAIFIILTNSGHLTIFGMEYDSNIVVRHQILDRPDIFKHLPVSNIKNKTVTNNLSEVKYFLENYQIQKPRLNVEFVLDKENFSNLYIYFKSVQIVCLFAIFFQLWIFRKKVIRILDYILIKWSARGD